MQKEITADTRIEIIRFKPLTIGAKLDEPVRLHLSYRVLGGLREAFTQSNIDEAYKLHDVDFRITSTINLRKRVASIAYREVKRLKMVRKAIFYWSRDRGSSSRIKVMVVDEYGNPNIIDMCEQLHTSLLDYSLPISLMGNELGEGEHTLKCDVNVKWGAHTFIQRGEARTTTQPIKVLINR